MSAEKIMSKMLDKIVSKDQAYEGMVNFMKEVHKQRREKNKYTTIIK